MPSYVSPFTGDVIQPTDVAYRSVTLSANTQLQWPVNGTSTTDYVARIMDVTATTAGLSIYLPPANQASVGNDVLMRNIGANSFTVTTYNNNSVITTVAASTSKYIYLTANPDAYGTWSNLTFGTGTSSADAGSLAGLGLTAIGSTLNQSHQTTSLTAAYTFLSGDRSKAYVWTGGATTATLPQASSLGSNWFVLLKNNGTGSITISTSNSELFDGSLTKTFAPSDAAFIICTGTGFVTVGFGQSTQFLFNVLTKPVTGGAYTLSASEASNTIQIYTGTLASNVTVTYPPVVNFYVVSNQCSAGGFTLTLTTGIGGGATATVPAGGQATLVCDGTNFLNANTTQAGASAISLISGTVGSPSLNFSAETNTGVYRPGAGRFGISILGSQIVDVNASGLSITGTGTFSGGVSGGAF